MASGNSHLPPITSSFGSSSFCQPFPNDVCKQVIEHLIEQILQDSPEKQIVIPTTELSPLHSVKNNHTEASSVADQVINSTDEIVILDRSLLESKTTTKVVPEEVNAEVLSKLNSIDKMLIHKKRLEGPFCITGRSKNQSSICVNLETAIMYILYPIVESELTRRFTEITECKKLQSEAKQKDDPFPDSQYEIVFNANGSSMKVIMKVLVTSCKIQVQTCGPRAKFLELMKIGHAEYFVTKFIDTIVNELIESRPNYNKEILHTIETEYINLKKQCEDQNKTAEIITDKKCYGKCNKNINIKNKDIYGQCKKCLRVEHFTCSGTAPYEKELILAGKSDFYCIRCVSEDPSLVGVEPNQNEESIPAQSADSPSLILDYQFYLQQKDSIIARLQDLLKTSNDKHKSLITATGIELSDCRASYRALANENERLLEERDTLLKIYKNILVEDELGKNRRIESTDDLKKMADEIRTKRERQRTDDSNHNVTSYRHKNRKAPFCHYFNNNKTCPFEGRCKYRHEKSFPCRNKNSCSRHLCQFTHPSTDYNNPFLDQGNYTWNGGRTEESSRPSLPTHPTKSLPTPNNNIPTIERDHPQVLPAPTSQPLSSNINQQPDHNNPFLNQGNYTWYDGTERSRTSLPSHPTAPLPTQNKIRPTAQTDYIQELHAPPNQPFSSNINQQPDHNNTFLGQGNHAWNGGGTGERPRMSLPIYPTVPLPTPNNNVPTVQTDYTLGLPVPPNQPFSTNVNQQLHPSSIYNPNRYPTYLHQCQIAEARGYWDQQYQQYQQYHNVPLHV